jgi:heat shock protein HslJ
MKKMMKFWTIASFLLLSFSSAFAQKSALSGSFELVQFDGVTVAYIKSGVTFTIEDKSISGNSGCNRYFGSATFSKKNGIKFGQIGASKMACLEEARSYTESTLFEKLSKVTHYQLKGKQLILLEGKKRLITFKKIAL